MSEPATLLVTVDSLRYDHYRHMEATRDFLGAAHPATFATNTATPSCFQSIIGGVYPGEVGVTPDQTVVPHVDADLKVAISTNRFLSERYGYDHGFDVFSEPPRNQGGVVDRAKEFVASNTTPQSRVYGALSRAYNAYQATVGSVGGGDAARHYRSAGDVVDELLAHVADAEHWFGWVHLMEPHHPYNPEDGPVSRAEAQRITRRLLDGRGSDRDAELGRELYRGEVEETDRHLARLWDAVPDDTRVAFVADHGELLGEYGEWGHHATMCPEILRVPLATRNLTLDSEVLSLVDVPAHLLGREYNDGRLGRELAYAASNGTHAAMSRDHVATVDGVRTLDGDPIEDPGLVRAMDEWADSAAVPVSKDDLPEDDLEALGYL